MIVVSDTSPLNYLVLIGATDVLPALFQNVYVPHSVIVELSNAKTPIAVRQWAAIPPPWLKVLSPSCRLPSTAALGDGEADAISLAHELHIREILMDERRGRNIARRERLMPLPTLAVLERAAAKQLIELAPVISRLQQTTMRLPPELVLAALDRDIARKLAKKNSPPINP